MVLTDFPYPVHRHCLFFFSSFGKHWRAQERGEHVSESERGALERKINGGSVNRLFLNWFMSKKTVQGYIQFRYKIHFPPCFITEQATGTVRLHSEEN